MKTIIVTTETIVETTVVDSEELKLKEMCSALNVDAVLSQENENNATTNTTE